MSAPPVAAAGLRRSWPRDLMTGATGARVSGATGAMTVVLVPWPESVRHAAEHAAVAALR